MRGGLGTRRIRRVERGAEVTVNALFDRTKPGFGAYGLDGGHKGGPAAILVKRAGDSEFRTFSEVSAPPRPRSSRTSC
jgi:N-methylhydantoinase B/oxoprolinase/acetone carboxylase alpha subunit